MFKDLANALRQWLRTPVVTAVALASLALGIGANVALGRMLQSLLFSTSARDPGMLALALASVIGAAILASLVPARRAARIDPMSALREE